MKKILFLLPLFLSLSSFENEANESTVVNTLKQQKPVTEFSSQVCNAQLDFVNSPTQSQQQFQLSETVSMILSHYLTSYSSRFGAKVATNVICQTLIGSQYSGSEQEWLQFIQQATSSVKKSGGKDMRLVLVGEKEKLFNQKLNNKEYKFYGEFNELKQTFYNVAILDKNHKSVYIISVSGSVRAEKAIKEEFIRVISSFKLNSNIKS